MRFGDKNTKAKQTKQWQKATKTKALKAAATLSDISNTVINKNNILRGP